MKFKELKLKSENEVKQMLKDLKAKAHELSVKLRLGQVKNVKEIGKIKKDIARVMTFLSSK
jgi:ribosomal protein L29